ncbi:hypothetical protein SY83_17610 [Paenibacillus swuensis]|uniref:VTT domain-containing protein n=1 Tax=Paenibacillus swuensis TaxID=1178515 RepID=A0A172TLE3_9BACL|nr:DedA family protein [Paenibacillus swuensis]ANE47802.1 hypothetical protein SY83_17610 [Paenibacillus swuensis]
MNDLVVQLVEQYGYLFFFLAFSLGPFGVPIPNEITIITGGTMADTGILSPWAVYACIILGMLTAVTVGYWLGKWLGAPLMKRFERKEKHRRWIQLAEQLVQRYGNIAMFIGYFIPVVRYVVPVLMGAGGIKFQTFAAYSYPGAVTWTVIFFGIGHLWGNDIATMLAVIKIL